MLHTDKINTSQPSWSTRTSSVAEKPCDDIYYSDMSLQSKSAKLTYPTCIYQKCGEWPCRDFAKASENYNDGARVLRKNFNDTFSHFDTHCKCDGQIRHRSLGYTNRGRFKKLTLLLLILLSLFFLLLYSNCNKLLSYNIFSHDPFLSRDPFVWVSIPSCMKAKLYQSYSQMREHLAKARFIVVYWPRFEPSTCRTPFRHFSRCLTSQRNSALMQDAAETPTGGSRHENIPANPLTISYGKLKLALLPCCNSQTHTANENATVVTLRWEAWRPISPRELGHVLHNIGLRFAFDVLVHLEILEISTVLQLFVEHGVRQLHIHAFSVQRLRK